MLFKKKCHLCSRKSKEVRSYFDDTGRKIHVCRVCWEYAERRHTEEHDQELFMQL